MCVNACYILAYGCKDKDELEHYFIDPLSDDEIASRF